MFTDRTPDKTFEYISLFDSAVKDGALSEEEVKQYASTSDLSLLEPHLIKGKKPCRFLLAELSKDDRRYLYGGDSEGEPPEEWNARLDAAILAVGVRGWIDPPKGAPEWSTRKVGFRVLASEAVLEYMGPDVRSEVAAALWLRDLKVRQAPTLEEEVTKN